MAGDTRDTSNSTTPSSSTTPPKYETFESANALPAGSGQNTAGHNSSTPVPKLTDAIKTVRIEDFKQVHMYPCVRESLLIGIAGGFGIGGVRGLVGGGAVKAANWAVGAFVFVALGNYELCSYKRIMEKAQMKRVVEVMENKRAEKDREAERKRTERRRKKEEDDKRLEEEKKKRGWKFW